MLFRFSVAWFCCALPASSPKHQAPGEIVLYLITAREWIRAAFPGVQRQAADVVTCRNNCFIPFLTLPAVYNNTFHIFSPVPAGQPFKVFFRRQNVIRLLLPDLLDYRSLTFHRVNGYRVPAHLRQGEQFGYSDNFVAGL
jgi:hypothetical protein